MACDAPGGQTSARLYAGDVRAMPGDGRPTGIFKQPIDAPVAVLRSGLAGDRQADRRVHGGPDKALHHYPAAHYALLGAEFRRLLGEPAADIGAFAPAAMGENVSTRGLTEVEVCIGDVFRLGSARLQLCQPRRPCWKIDVRFGCEGLARFVEAAGCSGWYYRVLEEGMVAPEEALVLLERDPAAPSLAELAELGREHRPDLGRLERAARARGIAADLAARLTQRLEWLRKQA